MQRRALIAIGVASAVAGLAALGAWAAQRQAGQAHEVTMTTVPTTILLPPLATRTVRVRCPAGSRVFAGGANFAFRSKDMFLGESFDGPEYVVRLTNVSAVFDAHTVLTVVCVKEEVGSAKDGHRHLLSPPVLKESEVPLPPDGRGTGRLECPRGSFVTGSGFELPGDGQVERSIPTELGTGWDFGLKNNEVDEAKAKVQAACVPEAVGPAKPAKGTKKHSHRLKRKIVKKAQTVGDKQTATITVTCPAGYKAVGGGYAVDAKHTNWTHGGSYPSDGSWVVVVRNDVVGSPLTVTAAAVCLGTKTA